MERDFKFKDVMQQRTKQFALRIIKLYQALPKSEEAQIIDKQVLRAGTYVGSNYRASRRAREFYIVIETMFGLEIFSESNIIKASLLHDL